MATPNAGAQLDQARDGTGANYVPEVTAEELEVRRQESRQRLSSSYPVSLIEAEFRERLGDGNLRQFGYDLFRAQEGGGTAITGEVGGNYTLGVGDQLIISFRGSTNASQTVRVDREGMIYAGQLPPIRAFGRSLESVRNDLVAETRRTMLGTEVSVSVGAVRSITVFVGGEVERPGQYQLTSLADLSAALARAGGIRRSGSLRSVRVIRVGGATTTVDLYGLLGIGTPSTVRLNDGDRVVIPVIGPTAAITGGVARPGIFEIRPGMTMQKLIEYAGGAVRARGFSVSLSRIARDGTETFVGQSGDSRQIVAGDAVQIIGGSAGGTAGRVLLRGYVQNRGPRALSDAPTVRALLGDVDDLRLGTYLPMGVLIRRDVRTATRILEPVNLLTALRGRDAVPLRNGDQLYVFGQEDIEFVNSAPVRDIILGQQRGAQQCVSLDRLRVLVETAQSQRLNSVLRSYFVSRSTTGGTVAATNTLLESAAAQKFQDAGQAVGSRSGGGLGVQTGQSVLLGAGQRTADRTDLVAACPDVFEEAPDLLPLLLEQSVIVGGSVRRSGAYPVADQVDAKTLMMLANGSSGGAPGMVVDLQSSAEVGKMIRFGDGEASVDLAAINIPAGSDIRFSDPQPAFEPGAVLLKGEFVRPGLYSIRKGETLSQLYARAGGLTEYAYTYGSIFTRQRIREQQREGLQRAASEMKGALLAATMRKSSSSVGGDSLAAAGALVEQIAMTEPTGRMTIEADPQVLAGRRDLDTVLEAGDTITVPKRPNFVLALGDVSNPGAQQFEPGKSVREYLLEAGGMSAGADKKRTFLILPDGRAQLISSSSGTRNAGSVPAGSTIIVPKNIDPLRSLDLIRDVTAIVAQVASSIATVGILATSN